VTLDPIPALAAEIPTVDNGGLTINEDGTMTVRYDIAETAVWEDGSPVTGFDVAFTYELLTDSRLQIREDLRALHQLIVPDSVQATAAGVEMTLVRPTIRYLSMFPVIVPVEQVGESSFNDDWDTIPWMSVGPFRFLLWDPSDRVTFVRNEQYGRVDEDGVALPYLDQVEIWFAPSEDELVAGTRLRTLDAAPLPPTPEMLAEMEATTGAAVQLADGPEWEHLAFQFGPGRLLANPGSMTEARAFRELVARSLDRAALVEGIFAGVIEPLNTVVGVSWPAAASDAWASYTQDSENAPDLLASAVSQVGPDPVVGPTVAFSTSSSLERTQVAGALLQALASTGVTVDVELLELGVYFRDRVLPGAFDVGEWAWRATPGPVGAVEDLEARFSLLPESDGYNFYRWGAGDSAVQGEEVEEIRAAIGELDGIVDLEELRDRLREVDEMLANEIVVVPLFPVLNAAVVWEDTIGGFNHVGNLPDTWNVERWHRIGP
jgi:peptide/nickel transport system substrate-binding protein